MYRIIFSTSYEPYTIICQFSNFRFFMWLLSNFLFIISSILKVWLQLFRLSLYISSLILRLRIKIPQKSCQRLLYTRLLT